MARSFSNAKVVSGLISKAINGRGFSSAASQGAAVSKARSGADSMVKKTGEEVGKSTEKTSWVPDPRTGFYRPGNVAEETDAAGLHLINVKESISVLFSLFKGQNSQISYKSRIASPFPLMTFRPET
ncbi:hypothetical protein OIU78_015301 [Salix suchowensis]|nr:hypothetical protein OIU78_015301 [Salix suchowensis]